MNRAQFLQCWQTMLMIENVARDLPIADFDRMLADDHPPHTTIDPKDKDRMTRLSAALKQVNAVGK